MSNHLIEVKNVYKIYNPGENEVRARMGSVSPSTTASSWPLSAIPVRANPPS